MRSPSVQEYLKDKLKDPYFKELYELDQQKLSVVKKIVAYRIKYKLSQGQLAEKVGVTQQHISKIENGEFSSISTLEKVLLAIGFTVKFEAVPLSQPLKDKLRRMAETKHSLQTV